MSLTIDRIGAVTLLTLDRPEVANAVSIEMAVGITEAIDAFAADEAARVLVVMGAGERAFCAGGDVSTLLVCTSHPHVDRVGPLGSARLEPGKPTIAAVNGYCFGGGLELAAWCDFRIAATNAEFGGSSFELGLVVHSLSGWSWPFCAGPTQTLLTLVNCRVPKTPSSRP